jgi:PAS domain-containing protein
MPQATTAVPIPDAQVFRSMIDRIPTAAYACDADGLITYYNDKAVEVWGRAPRLNHVEDRWCGSYRLFAADGSPVEHAQCWMALALRERRDYLAQEILVERPDAALVPVLAYATPVFDADGALVAGINMLVNISEQKRMARLLLDAQHTRRQYMSILAEELHVQLRAMSASLDVLRRSPPAADDGVRAVAALGVALREMSAMVDDLLSEPKGAVRS